MRNFLAAFMVIFLLFSPQSAEAGLFSITKKLLKEIADYFDKNPEDLLYWGIKAKRNELENKRSQENEKKRKESTLSRGIQRSQEILDGRRNESIRRRFGKPEQPLTLQPGLVIESKKEKVTEIIPQSEK